MKIRPVWAELFYADRRADGHDWTNSPFSQFCKSALKRNEMQSLRGKLVEAY